MKLHVTSAVFAALLPALIAGCSPSGGPVMVDPPIVEANPGPSPAPAVVTTKTGVEMVLIPGGEFSMGDESGEEDERPLRKVRVSPFYIDRSEVTQASYQALMGKNPSKWPAADRPVERASWVLSVQYCNMRSLGEGFRPCYDPKTLACDFAADGYRLPTEAEWEYACRAGSTGRWSFGDDPARLGEHGWFKANAGKATHPVRQKQPNAWGLYDMHGNLAEWCNDYYAERYDARQTSDPRGPDAGEERVLRGGSWSSSPEACRAGARFSQPPGFADVCFGYEAYGFRCVRRAESISPPSIRESKP